MRLGTITEFGATASDYQQILDDVHGRMSTRRARFPCRQYLVSTLGSTDLLEILQFDHFLYLASVGMSAVQAFRRSIGVICPEDHELPPAEERQRRVGTLERILEPNAEYPFVSVVYAKIAPLLLSVPAAHDADRHPLQWELMRRLSRRDCPLWADHARLSGPDARRADTDLRVAPLIGLDTVELVLLVRSRNVDAMGSLAIALRYQQLGGYFPANRHRSAVLRAGELLKRGVSDEAWDSSPVIEDSTTIAGLTLQRLEAPDASITVSQPPTLPPGRHEESGSAWRLEPVTPLDAPAAATALVLRRCNLPYSRIEDAVPSMPGRSRAGPETTGEGRDQAPGASAAADASVLMLFDRSDLLLLPAAGSRHPSPDRPMVGPLQTSEVRHLLEDLLTEHSYLARSRLRTSTEIALGLALPLPIAYPNQELVGELRATLRQRRRQHLTRGETALSWMSLWLNGLKKGGGVYAVTNGGVNIISAVLDYLEHDLEGFLDTLPAVAYMVGLAEKLAKDGTSPEEMRSLHLEMIDVYDGIQALATSRGRRDHPLRPPRGTLAFETHAGHRVYRDAFITFVVTLGRIFGQVAPVLVLDVAGSGASYRSSRYGAGVIRVSAMALHHPLHWVFAHEVAHGAFRRTRLVASEAQEAAAEVAEVGRFRVEPNDSLDAFLQETRIAVRRVAYPDIICTIFLDSLASITSEVLADLLLRDSLRIPGEQKDATDERFWFVYGPSLVYFSRHRIGGHLSYGSLVRIVLRLLLVDLLLEPGSAFVAPERVTDLVLSMKAVIGAKQRGRGEPGDGHATTGAASPERIARDGGVARLISLREDLAPQKGPWQKASLILGRALEQCAEMEADAELPRVVTGLVRFLQTAWLSLSRSIYPEVAASPVGPCNGTPRVEEAVRFLYPHYISELMDLWPKGRPWLPFIAGHRPSETERRRSRFESDDSLSAAISLRGGLFAGDLGQQRYCDASLKFVLSLGEFGRERHYSLLSRYLADEQLAVVGDRQHS